MSDAGRLALVGLGLALVIGGLSGLEAWMVAGPRLLSAWARRLPEAAAILLLGVLLAILTLPGVGVYGATYVILTAAAMGLVRARLPEARQTLTAGRAAVLLLLGGLGVALFVGLAFGVLAPAPA